MNLSKLLENLKQYQVYNFRELDIKGITCDSRKVKNNFIFVVIRGIKEDGTKYLSEAIQRGAKAVVYEEFPSLEKGVVGIKVKNARRAYSHLCAEFYHNPSLNLKVVGVTGTNGKTTITYLIEKILKIKNRPALLIGTINYHYKNKIILAHNTTPSAEELQFLLSQAKKERIEYAVMEVSSHALAQGRVDDIYFSYAIFTNLTQDHLDYHRNMEEYFQAKAKLLHLLKPEGKAIINIDDFYGRRLLKVCRYPIITYGLNKKADIYADCIEYSIKGTDFILHTPKNKIKMHTSLLGTHNIYNILAGVGFALEENTDLGDVKKAISEFKPPPGRLEKVYDKDFAVFVDYAHTPSALENVLSVLRKVTKKRIILVFGCGGERDRLKRPKMGKIATELAEEVIVTSDNPRSEDPLLIIKEIISGIKKKNYKVILERKEAIFSALKEAKKQDIVLVAGKGHENYQIIKDRVIPFNDAKIIREYFKNKQ